MEKLVEMLQHIADKLGVTVGYLWPKVVLAHWMTALGDLIVLGLALGISYPLFWRGLREWVTVLRDAKSSAEDYRFIMPVIKTIWCGLVAVIATLVGLSLIGTLLGTLVSPEGSLVLKVLRK